MNYWQVLLNKYFESPKYNITSNITNLITITQVFILLMQHDVSI